MNTRMMFARAGGECCHYQYQFPMKGARVGEEKSHVQDDVRRQKSQMSGVVRADFRQKL